MQRVGEWKLFPSLVVRFLATLHKPMTRRSLTTRAPIVSVVRLGPCRSSRYGRPVAARSLNRLRRTKTGPAPETKVTCGPARCADTRRAWYLVLTSLLTSRDVLGVALLVAGGVVAARALATRRDAGPQAARAGEPPGLQEARAALRMRYANGEISREDYLQGKVELED